jgi:hypothetical protein
MSTREALHELVDELPESMLDEVERYLRAVAPASGPTLRELAMSAPIDDEPLTPEDIKALDEARQSINRGRAGISTGDVRAIIRQT